MKRDWSMCTFRSMAASTAQTIDEVLAAGANIIVAGSAVFGSNIEQNVRELQEKISSYSKKAE